jgi:hypothetical protein
VEVLKKNKKELAGVMHLDGSFIVPTPTTLETSACRQLQNFSQLAPAIA